MAAISGQVRKGGLRHYPAFFSYKQYIRFFEIFVGGYADCLLVSHLYYLRYLPAYDHLRKFFAQILVVFQGLTKDKIIRKDKIIKVLSYNADL